MSVPASNDQDPRETASETSTPDEFGLIAAHFRPLTEGRPETLGLGDDAAALPLDGGTPHVISTDALVAGVHFFADDPPERIAQKALRVNLSDLAAMGAEPVTYTLAVAWPDGTEDAWIKAFAAGLKEDQDRFGIYLSGGDTVATPGPLMVSITVIGAAGKGGVLKRSGAQDGDAIFVTGTIGDGALGLTVRKGGFAGLEEGHRQHLLNRYLCPEPRTSLGPRLVGLATAALDVSDGLVADLGHVLEQSGMGADLRLDWVPFSDAAREVMKVAPQGLLTAVTGGDDYELLFTAAPADRARIRAAALAMGIKVAEIGTMRAGQGLKVLRAAGDEVQLETVGYRHF